MTDLPVPVKEHPHWRVNFRPSSYDEELLPSLGACLKVIEATKVRLRGWDYPHLSRRTEQRGQGSNFVASWSDFGHLEYWRFYQSGQFLHLFSVREAWNEAWKEQLRNTARGHLGHFDVDWEHVPGFFSLNNFIYTVTEIFEFAARVAQHGVYEGPVSIGIRISGIEGFILTPDWDRAWYERYAPSESALENNWIVESADLIASSSEHSFRAILWFFERFGWLEPAVEVIQKDQLKFLEGKI